MDNRLRVGVLLDRLATPAWQGAAIDLINRSGCAKVVSFVETASSRSADQRKGFRRRCIGWLERLVELLDARVKRPLPDASETVACDTSSASGNGSTIAQEFDVLLILADVATSSADLPCPRFGRWYFTSAGKVFEPADGSRVGLVDFMCRHQTIETTLEIYDVATRTRRAASSTHSAIHSGSYLVSRNEHLWKCSTMIVRALRDCRAAAARDYLQLLTRRPEQAHGHDGVTRMVVGVITLLAARVWRMAYRRIFRERWVLMAAADDGAGAEKQFLTLVPPPGRFWADPHVVEHEGAHHLFFEDAAIASGVGHISVMSDHGDGHFGQPRPVLQKPYHLSYPFVFNWQGDWYLLPESAENRTVELYRAVEFPYEWEPAGRLLENVEAFDATLVEHDGRWWLFATVRELAGASTWDELHVFHAEAPTSRDWRPHRNNPVISDVRRARPAGRFFTESGRLYRPSQDCSRRYGYAVKVNEVLRLDEFTYEEETVRSIPPDSKRGIVAIHSYSRAGWLTVIDAMRRETKMMGA